MFPPRCRILALRRVVLCAAAATQSHKRFQICMSSRGKSARSGTRGYAHLVELEVPVARVWRALTDPRLIRVWSGQEAEIDPREGGLYRVGKRNAEIGRASCRER